MTSGRRQWRASAPSNIALIKYMGKTDTGANRPTNTSLSYTLTGLRSIVELEVAETTRGASSWEPLDEFDGRKFSPLHLSDKGKSRFLAYFEKIKAQFDVNESFIVRSANDFPSDCGLASSASSFAALTMVAMDAFSDLKRRAAPSTREASDLSRQGSGSSCRSFFKPWAIWNEDGATDVPELSGIGFIHQVVVVDEHIKSVSSSEAHKRVISSRLFEGRPERAELRAKDLIRALRANDLRTAFEITWAEFWDMHALFETSTPSFGYMNGGSLDVLRWVRSESAWDQQSQGPLVTMDAGPNVHLLHPIGEFGNSFAARVIKQFSPRFRVITSGGENGR